VEQEGYLHLVQDLLKPLPPPPGVTQPQALAPPLAPPAPHEAAGPVHGGMGGAGEAAGQAPQEAAGQAGGDGRGPSEGEEPAPVGGEVSEEARARGAPAAPGHSVEPEPVFTPLDPQQLEFTDWEKADIDRLWSMFRTPRSVKRYVNIYRLLRAGLASPEEVARFEGTQAQPGEYQLALLLLAAVTSFPNQAARFLAHLDDWLELPEVTARPDDEGVWRWQDVLDTCQAVAPPAGASESEDLAESQAGPAPPDPAWELMLACLEEITQQGFQQPFSRATLEKWVARVARYSFSVHPGQAV